MNYDFQTIFIVIAGFIFCITISMIIRRLIYNKEFNNFLIGNRTEKKYQVDAIFETDKIKLSNISDVESSFESKLAAMKMIWRKGASGYCFFNGLFPAYPMKCVVEIVKEEEGFFKLRFHFYDRYLNPVMIGRIKKQYLVKMKKLYESLTT